ncbi:MAG TPA: gamma carbonic anhydrase family protein [bacterium]|jgi:carbonic anhydrase/acetyltransferase-like protein (isoleucine patch superfamily)|nr:gamma carbonic anhydrase family protein [bacterium]HPM45522.1 gamma carbonic anhydrase family protein [bacterium]HQI04307.1 gamma carbonic anhydrase family protein [bacterium]HQJ59791.1 gamma carbonic anhydrase family protein [bacterium]
MIINYLDKIPDIKPDSFIFRTSVIIGDTTIGKNSSIWFGTIVRGDVNKIVIGERTNIQDNSTIHVTTSLFPTTIGNEVTIGHNAVIHGSTIENRVLIGMGAVLLDGCHIKQNSIIAAQSVLRNGTKIPEGVLVAGNPAKIKRDLSYDEIEGLAKSAANYVKYSYNYLTYSQSSIYSNDEIKSVIEMLRTNVLGSIQ